MYIPPKNEESSIDLQLGLIEKYPLGTIFTSGPEGNLVANHFVFTVIREDIDKLVLRTHFARANKHHKDLRQVDECLVVFQGINEYITPLWYTTTQETHKKAVPTWDYTSVHVYGKPTVIEDGEWLDTEVRRLVDKQEYAIGKKWTVDDAPKNYTDLLKKAIFGLEIEVTRIEGKWKMAQDLCQGDFEGNRDGVAEQYGERGVCMAQVYTEARERRDAKKAAQKAEAL